MSVRVHPLRWVPAFVVGICAAAAAEIATGLLLYAGPGLMRSLTTVLAVESAALGIGIWTAPGPRPDLVDSIRRRWLLCLVAFLLATVFSAFWSLVQSVGGSALGQGLGLAFLAGLPLYACGGVLGAMATANATDPLHPVARVGAPPALGAALGFAATGMSLPEVLTPASLFLVCLVLLSAAGLVYGSVLDTRLRVELRGALPAPTGEVRVEDRQLLARDRAARILAEGPFVRRWIMLEGEAPTPWDVAAYRAFGPPRSAASEDPGASEAEDAAPPPRALLVGGGASALSATVLRRRPDARLTVVERSPAVLEMGREHMDAVAEDPDGRLDVHVGNLDDVAECLDGPYGTVLVDTAALAPVGGLGAVSARGAARLHGVVALGGVLILGPGAVEGDGWTFPAGWVTATYRRSVPEALTDLGVGITEEEVLTVGRRPGAVGGSSVAAAAGPDGATSAWPDTVEDFVRDRTVEEARG